MKATPQQESRLESRRSTEVLVIQDSQGSNPIADKLYDISDLEELIEKDFQYSEGSSPASDASGDKQTPCFENGSHGDGSHEGDNPYRGHKVKVMGTLKYREDSLDMMGLDGVPQKKETLRNYRFV